MKKPTPNATGGSQEVEIEQECCLKAQEKTAKACEPFFWGVLQDALGAGASVNLYLSKANLICTVGSDTKLSTIYLPVFGIGISPCHCTISWDGESADSVKLRNNSTDDALQINAEPVGRRQAHPLRDGDTITFINSKGATTTGVPEEYFFLYHHRATKCPPFVSLYFEDSLTLGSGSYGSVKKVVKRTTDRVYAVKTMAINGGDLLHRSLTEICIMRRMSHPAICQLYECFTDMGRFALVMDYLDGGDLGTYLRKEGPLIEHETRDILSQVFSGVEYVHSLNIIHGDIKLENVLVSRDEPVRAKLCDFGLSDTVCPHRRLMNARGTPAYAAPEVLYITSFMGFDTKADCWSLSVMMFFMLSGQGIYGGHFETFIPQRAVDWTALSSATEHAQELTRQLLNPNPHLRISARDGLNHEWFSHGNEHLEQPGQIPAAARKAGQDEHSETCFRIKASSAAKPTKKVCKGRGLEAEKSRTTKTSRCHSCQKKYIQVKGATKKRDKKNKLKKIAEMHAESLTSTLNASTRELFDIRRQVEELKGCWEILRKSLNGFLTKDVVPATSQSFQRKKNGSEVKRLKKRPRLEETYAEVTHPKSKRRRQPILPAKRHRPANLTHLPPETFPEVESDNLTTRSQLCSYDSEVDIDHSPTSFLSHTTDYAAPCGETFQHMPRSPPRSNGRPRIKTYKSDNKYHRDTREWVHVRDRDLLDVEQRREAMLDHVETATILGNFGETLDTAYEFLTLGDHFDVPITPENNIVRKGDPGYPEYLGSWGIPLLENTGILAESTLPIDDDGRVDLNLLLGWS
ncbi:hypothetical protein D9613_009410 [Agrocybe pediades]|uniref:Protein kinase domain-containing protein n=1 Tax=Agrocybe pediades TaxID=84607 RepID=A0A8H4R4W6_9AGAR|nr:hypothetical protein D9613_009410 [Agrocybe pediades]